MNEIMRDYFNKRTTKHIELVGNYLNQISSLDLDINGWVLKKKT